MTTGTAALLVIAHGTREPRGAAEMEELLALLRARHDAPVANAWLEDFAEPDVGTAVGALAAAGATRIGAVPFLNFAAYHADTDIPAEVTAARAAHPDVAIAVGGVLGHHPALLELARRRVGEAGADEILVVSASGSSNAGANSEVAKAARLLAEATGHRWAEIAFAGVTWPRVDEVLARAARAGARGAVLFSWSLLAGVLERRVHQAASEAAAAAGIALRSAGRFGPDPLVAEAVLDRFPFDAFR